MLLTDIKKIPYLLSAIVLFLIVVVFWVQICRALAYIHNCIGICHRDIKPQNLLVRFFFLKKLVFVAQDLFCMWLLICMNAWYLSYQFCGLTKAYWSWSFIGSCMLNSFAKKKKKSITLVVVYSRHYWQIYINTKKCWWGHIALLQWICHILLYDKEVMWLLCQNTSVYVH